MQQDINIFHRPYGATLWTDLGRFVVKNSLPKPDSDNLSNLAQTTFSLVQPKDDDDNLVIFNNADDFCITDSNNLKTVFAEIAAGQLIKQEHRIITYERQIDTSYVPYVQYNLTIENREFSKEYLVFRPELYINATLQTLLDIIFANVRDLGGVIEGNTIGKYACTVDNQSIVPSFSFEGTNRECLNELCKQMGLNWRIGYYVAPHTTNNIQLVQQVIISK